MDHLDDSQPTPKEQWWSVKTSRSEDRDQLLSRIEILEGQISAYESLLEDLPDLFERKFQQRLEPLLERYRLLEQGRNADGSRPPALPPGNEASAESRNGKVIQLGRLRWPRLLRRRSAGATL